MLGPWRGGRRGGGWIEPWFGSEVWDPFGLGLGISDWEQQGGGDETSAVANAHVDWRETDNAHIFVADLPGLKKEDVKVQVEDGNMLQISGQRVQEQEKTDDKWHRAERRLGSFVRQFRLPKNADSEKIKCGLENGVLKVTVPKKEAEQNPKDVRTIDVA
ncbi:17.6 kDa class I heat shock protein-like [Prunus avium]|uniref:17.6 kDa class I heat shock protein-like n=1 Tax=Prunus avium TaxID=42229 RepID=A0A6P5SW07_PRUAV|nr:17.6 kDa class I heat shock protein-like [Prunus avium]